MRFLVTGGAGLVGSNIVQNLISRGHEVSVIDNLQAYPFNYHSLFGTQGLDINFHKGDIRDTSFINNIFHHGNFDVVIHAAAYADVGGCVLNADEDFTSNVIGTHNILECSKKHSVGKVVFISSASVYGASERTMFSEEDATVPISTYGNSKLWGENQTILYGKLYNMKTTAIRYFSVYGSPQLPKVGSHSWCVAIFSLLCLSGTPITIYGDGNQIRDFTHVKDIAEGTVLASLTDRCNGEILNLGYGQPVTINTVADYIFNNIRQTGIKYTQHPMGDPLGGYADTSKMKSLLNWAPTISIEDGVKEYGNWITCNFDYLQRIKYVDLF